MSASDHDQATDMRAWLKMVEGLRHAPDWAADELPIEMIQTHISVVLLGKHHVLKLKKPVDFGFLDYTTPAKRRFACQSEVELNRRLCPDTYLGVQPIAEIDGQPRLSDSGRIIDYGVLMKRLPAERMLDQMVAKDEATEAIIDRVAERLSRFHQAARRGPDIEAYGRPEVIRANWEENFTQTLRYVGRTLTAAEFDAIRLWTTRWMNNAADLLQSRQRDGRICEGHGDVRAESICAVNGICVFDCIEFNERFRCSDIASEVAFLAVDLDARGRPDLGYYFSERYQARTTDQQLFSLLPFYRCYRAYVRGKVLSFRLDEPEFDEAQRQAAAVRAKSYFHLARRYAAPLERPAVILVAGLSGTGKTALARALGGELGLRVVSSDAIRRSVFGQQGHPHEYGEGPYTAEANRVIYNKLIETGRTFLREDRGVILDATFRRVDDRRRASDMADQSDADWFLIECKLAPESIRSRLERRTARKESMSEATWATYLRQRQDFDPVQDSTGQVHLVLDTGPTLSSTSHAAADWLRENSSKVS